jgi:uncharacterized protein (TIGR00369 family)
MLGSNMTTATVSPVAHLSGRRLIDLADGRATLAIPASDWFRDPKGRVDSGMLAFLADMTHFHAVVSMLPEGAVCTTAELSITFLGQPPDAEGELRASSEVAYADERNALALAFVRDDQGRPLAYSSSRYFIFPAGTYRSPRGAEASPAGTRSLLPCRGTVSGGAIALLAKSATAGAVQAAAEADTRFSALDLKANFLRAIDADGTELRAAGKVRHRGRRLVIADTTVTTEGGLWRPRPEPQP